MKKIFSVLIMLLLFIGCKKEEVTIDDTESEFILHCDASNEDTTTTEPRMIYSDAGFVTNNFFKAGTISAAWEAGEIIEFCFRQTIASTTTIKKTTTTVTTSNGKNCSFTVTVPSGIDPTKTYDVYAVSGGYKGGTRQGTYINNTTPQYVNFYFDIANVKTNLTMPIIRGAIVQVSRRPGVPGNTTNISFKFSQIGSLMGVAIKNPSSNSVDYDNLQLYASNTANQWVWDLSNANTKYDLFAGAMAATGVKTNILQFLGTGSFSIPANSTNTIYQYFVPTTTAPSNLVLELHDLFQLRQSTTDPTAKIADPGTLKLGTRYYINRNFDINTSVFTR